MDHMHAYNYWKKAFFDSANGVFSKQDFEDWFRSGTNPPVTSVMYFPDEGLIDNGSPEHFDLLMRQAFIAMLDACASGVFGAANH